jgi:hypothetical protein
VSSQARATRQRSGARRRARAGAGRSSRGTAALHTGLPAFAAHIDQQSIPWDRSTPRMLSLRKPTHGAGVQRDGVTIKRIHYLCAIFPCAVVTAVSTRF